LVFLGVVLFVCNADFDGTDGWAHGRRVNSSSAAGQGQGGEGEGNSNNIGSSASSGNSSNDGNRGGNNSNSGQKVGEQEKETRGSGENPPDPNAESRKSDNKQVVEKHEKKEDSQAKATEPGKSSDNEKPGPALKKGEKEKAVDKVAADALKDKLRCVGKLLDQHALCIDKFVKPEHHEEMNDWADEAKKRQDAKEKEQTSAERIAEKAQNIEKDKATAKQYRKFVRRGKPGAKDEHNQDSDSTQSEEEEEEGEEQASKLEINNKPTTTGEWKDKVPKRKRKEENNNIKNLLDQIGGDVGSTFPVMKSSSGVTPNLTIAEFSQSRSADRQPELKENLRNDHCGALVKMAVELNPELTIEKFVKYYKDFIEGELNKEEKIQFGKFIESVAGSSNAPLESHTEKELRDAWGKLRRGWSSTKFDEFSDTLEEAVKQMGATRVKPTPRTAGNLNVMILST
jgi:hypothetical protein